MGPEIFGVELAQSWAEAVAAVGTTAAFVVAAVVYASQQRDRRDDEAKQARLVFRGKRTWASSYNEEGRLDVMPSQVVQPGDGCSLADR